MSLCRLVVEDYWNWRKKQPLELVNIGYRKYDTACWREFIEEDLKEGKRRNWWYHFGNITFLKFLNFVGRKLRE